MLRLVYAMRSWRCGDWPPWIQPWELNSGGACPRSWLTGRCSVWTGSAKHTSSTTTRQTRTARLVAWSGSRRSSDSILPLKHASWTGRTLRCRLALANSSEVEVPPTLRALFGTLGHGLPQPQHCRSLLLPMATQMVPGCAAPCGWKSRGKKCRCAPSIQPFILVAACRRSGVTAIAVHCHTIWTLLCGRRSLQHQVGLATNSCAVSWANCWQLATAGAVRRQMRRIGRM